MFFKTSAENTKDKYDIRLSCFIVAYLFIQALNLFVKLVLGDFPGWDYITRGILFLFLIFTFKPVLYRNAYGAIMTEFILILMLSFTLLTGGARFDEYGMLMFNLVAVFLPLAISLHNINNKKILLDQLYIVSWPIHILLLSVLFNVNHGSYSMSGGYALVLQLLIVLDHYYERNKLYDLLVVILDFIIIVLFASRGPIICVITMIVIYICFSHSLSQIKRLSLVFCYIFVGLFIYLYRNIFLNHLLVLMGQGGRHSRTMEMLLKSTLAYDSGRQSIIDQYFSIIDKRPLIGYGLLGGWISPDLYPHNLFVEILVSFGILLGPLIMVAILLLFWKAIISNNNYEQRLSHILFSFCTSLLLSSSFVLTPEFFMLLALGLSNVKVRIRVSP